MSGPNAAYGPEKPDSSPIFSVPPLPPALTAGAAVAAPPAGAPLAGALAALGVDGPHAASTDAAVTAPAPYSAARSSVRRETIPAWSCFIACSLQKAASVRSNSGCATYALRSSSVLLIQ